MFAVRSWNIFTPTFYLAKNIDVVRSVSGTKQWTPAKQVYVNQGGEWRLVWVPNSPPAAGNFHQFMQVNLNGEFSSPDDTITYNNFWSTNNNQPISVSGGVARLGFNTITKVSVEETKKLYVATTNGSSVATLESNQYAQATTTGELAPLDEEDSSGTSNVKWEIYEYPANMFSNLPAFINGFPSNTTFNMNRTARITGSQHVFRIRRTYYRYSAFNTLQTSVALAVSPGQVYTISTNPTAVSTSGSSRLTFKTLSLTGPTEGATQFFVEGSDPKESAPSAYGSITLRSHTITIPSGHYYLRPHIRVDAFYKISAGGISVPGLWYDMDFLRVKRDS